jgi:hypothetical protein
MADRSHSVVIDPARIASTVASILSNWPRMLDLLIDGLRYGLEKPVKPTAHR